jgi:hypothetical protein
MRRTDLASGIVKPPVTVTNIMKKRLHRSHISGNRGCGKTFPFQKKNIGLGKDISNQGERI